jgi:serine/threonine protein kinase
MFSERVIQRITHRLQLQCEDVKGIISTYSMNPGNISLKGQLFNGDYRGINEGKSFNVRFGKSIPVCQRESDIILLLELILYHMYPDSRFVPLIYTLSEVPFQLKSKDIGRRVMLLTEYLPTCLGSFICSNKRKSELTWQVILRISIDICKALSILHNVINICHGSLHISNIYLDSHLIPKLTSFQECTHYHERYRSYCSLVDIHSLGVLFMTIIAEMGVNASPMEYEALAVICMGPEEQRPTAEMCSTILEVLQQE